MAEGGRIKRGYIRKVLSPVMGYGDYHLLHFVFDLSMWTVMGTKKNVANRTGVALRHLLKSSPWTPEYWRVHHRAMLDMQRQCGNASLFRTRAPYERSFPYHQWVMHEQHVQGKARLHLPVAETLHIAWVLLQLDSGYIRGAKKTLGRGDRTWHGHVLGPKDEGSAVSTLVSYATRLEFQDGKRKPAQQRYHGRGTAHSHSLDFLENVDHIGLEEKLQATIPDQEKEPFLRGLVLDSQQDYTDSKRPVLEDASTWDPETQTLALKHTATDKEHNLRAYMKPTMEITKCHEDVQHGATSDGQHGNLLRYVATYSMKASSSLEEEWLNGGGAAQNVAAGLLRGLRIMAPEMVLTLAQERFPQVQLSGSVVDIAAPTFDMVSKPGFVTVYENSQWRPEAMSLLEFLRKANKDGGIIHYIRQKHTDHVMQQAQTVL